MKIYANFALVHGNVVVVAQIIIRQLYLLLLYYFSMKP